MSSVLKVKVQEEKRKTRRMREGLSVMKMSSLLIPAAAAAAAPAAARLSPLFSRTQNSHTRSYKTSAKAKDQVE